MPSLRYFTKKYRKRTVEGMRKSLVALTGKVIFRTPVLTGTARASWNPSIGAPVANNVYVNNDNPFATRTRYESVINRVQVGDVYCLANGLPYIRPLEYDQHSAQAPNGMLAISIAEWQDIVDKSFRDF